MKHNLNDLYQKAWSCNSTVLDYIQALIEELQKLFSTAPKPLDYKLKVDYILALELWIQKAEDEILGEN